MSLALPPAMIIKGHDVWQLLKGTGREILDDKVPSLAAQTAYYFFFSLFPLLLFLTPLIGVVADAESVMRWVNSQLAAMVGAEAFIPLRAAIENVVLDDNAPGLISMGALLAAWSGSNIFGALMTALNTAYDVEEERPFFRKQLVRLAMFAVSAVRAWLWTIMSTLTLASARAPKISSVEGSKESGANWKKVSSASRRA